MDSKLLQQYPITSDDTREQFATLQTMVARDIARHFHGEVDSLDKRSEAVHRNLKDAVDYLKLGGKENRVLAEESMSIAMVSMLALMFEHCPLASDGVLSVISNMEESEKARQ